MRKIPFGKPIIDQHEKNAVLKVLDGDILVHGPLAKQFETEFANFMVAPHCVSVSSCTAALHLAYFYHGIKSGDEVIVPAQTHNATAHAVELSGGTPVFVDCERETGNIDISRIEAAITPKTRALSVVHFLGMPVQMTDVVAIAKKHQLFLVEDCALAIGSYYQGTHCGLFGDVGCFSFYPVKHMTTAEGGIVSTRNPDIAAKISRQKAFGVDRTVSERQIPGVYDVTMLGFNYRMNELAAAMGIEQLKKIRSFLARRKENFELLRARIQDVPEISLLQSSHGPFQSSYYCLSVILGDRIKAKRFEIVKLLNEQGVGTSVYYPHPVPMLSYYRNKYGFKAGQFPNAERISYGSIALSVGPHLGAEDMEYTAESLKSAVLAQIK